MTATQLQNSPQAGDTAPDFSAPSTSGSNVSLSSYRGKSNVLLAFFPLAFTSTCTKELGWVHIESNASERRENLEILQAIGCLL